MKKRVLFITNLPAPYKIRYFNELGKYVDLTVVFERSSAKNRNAAWTASASIQNFNAIFPRGINFGDEMSLDISIMKILKQNRDCIVLLNGYSSPTEILAVQCMAILKIKFGIVCDGLLQKTEPAWNRWLKKSLISKASFWMSSGKETDMVLEDHGADSCKIYRYPFSSIGEKDIERVPYCRAEYKKIIGCKKKYMLLYVGQMIYRKGIDQLLEAIKNIDIDFQLYMIGSKFQINDQRVVNIDFLDHDELKKYYMAADLFVLPSREDIWGLVINEAMGYGVPVLATDRCGAALEMIKEGKNGALIPAGNIEALRNKIVSILTDNRTDVYMMETVRTAHKYTIEKMAQCTWNIICQQYEGDQKECMEENLL